MSNAAHASSYPIAITERGEDRTQAAQPELIPQSSPANADLRVAQIGELRANLARMGGLYIPKPLDKVEEQKSLREELAHGLDRGEALSIVNSPRGGGLTWAMSVAAERAQRDQRWQLWLDGQRSLHAEVLRSFGLPLSRLLIGRLPVSETLQAIIEIAVSDGAFSTIVVDSASSWRAGAQSYWRRLAPKLRAKKCALIWIYPQAPSHLSSQPWQLDEHRGRWRLSHNHRSEQLELPEPARPPPSLELYQPARSIPGESRLVRARNPRRQHPATGPASKHREGRSKPGGAP